MRYASVEWKRLSLHPQPSERAREEEAVDVDLKGVSPLSVVGFDTHR